MKKYNIFAIAAAVLVAVSYSLDGPVADFFKDKSTVLDGVFSLATNFSVLLLIMLIIPSLMLYKNKKSLFALWSAFLASFALSFILKLIFLRERPVDAFVFPFTSIINYSFPSMHAMIAFSLAPFLMLQMPKQRYLWVSYASLVGFSRLYFNFHFLSDVVFGGFAGYFLGDLLLKYNQAGKKRGKNADKRV